MVISKHFVVEKRIDYIDYMKTVYEKCIDYIEKMTINGHFSI